MVLYKPVQYLVKLQAYKFIHKGTNLWGPVDQLDNFSSYLRVLQFLFNPNQNVKYETLFSIGEKFACLADMFKVKQSLQQAMDVHRAVRRRGSHIF
jgi:hypothetical protein